jgi:uncharacterized protein with gpF-like domain
MSIANSKKEAQKIAAKSMAIQMKIIESFARAIRRIFTRMANDFQATYIDTRQVLSLTSYKPDIIALLRDYYSRTAKIFKNNIRKGLKLSSEEIAQKIDSQLAVFVKGHSMAQSDIIITTLQKNLVQDLNDVMIEAAADGIVLDKSVVAKNTRDKFLKKSKNRAETIAQTEVGTASGYSTQTEAQVLKQHENLNVKKIWVSMLDDVTRISHVFADGQIQNMDDPFIVGGEALQYPKDPNGSIENTINCRCERVFLTK